MLVSGYNNIMLLPNYTMLYYVFSGPLSLRAYVPEIKFNNNTYSAPNMITCTLGITHVMWSMIAQW